MAWKVMSLMPHRSRFNRRSRRVKTDRVDAEKLLRTLMGWARGERRICSMVRAPSPAEEDERRLPRERGTLISERVRHVNRIKSLLATQGVFDFEPMHKDRRTRLERPRNVGTASRCHHG